MATRLHLAVWLARVLETEHQPCRPGHNGVAFVVLRDPPLARKPRMAKCFAIPPTHVWIFGG
jgi:hypothetical protein